MTDEPAETSETLALPAALQESSVHVNPQEGGVHTAAAQPAEEGSRLLAAIILVAITAASLWIALNPAFIAQFKQWGYLGGFLISLFASASIILPIPGLPLAIALGTTLNPWLLGVATGLGSAIGESSGYLAGVSGRTLVPAGQAARYDQLEEWTRKYGAFAVFVVAVTPFPFFDLAGIAAGAIRMPFWQFFLATFVGKTIKYIIAILLGVGAFEGILRWMQ
jgi:uncharacterized membrane protein YdjX (TVP38/TMEM64 family)